MFSVFISLILYAGGIGLYHISLGWFRKTLLTVATLLGPLYILLLIATANPSGVEGGWGLGFLVLFASLPGLPASGVLFAYLGDKLSNSLEEKYAAISLKLLSLAFLPLLLIYLFMIAPELKRIKVQNHKFKGHYAIQFNSTYLDLPCRREFRRFRPERDCSLQKPRLRTDFEKVNALKIWPKGHSDQNNRCRPKAPDRENIARFCDLKLLPYNVDLFFEKSKLEKLEHYHEHDRNTPNNQNNSDNVIGNLKILQEKKRTYSNGRSPSIEYHFKLKNSSATAFLHCYNSYSSNRAIFECNMKVNYIGQFWADSLRFKAPLEQIENEANRISAEVAEYYSYLLATYEAAL